MLSKLVIDLNEEYVNEDYLEENMDDNIERVHDENHEILEPHSQQDTVDAIINPEIGMVFPNGEEFGYFVYSYAHKIGFEVFVRSSALKKVYKDQGYSRTNTGEKEGQHIMMKRMRMRCRKGGENKHKGSNVTGCKFVVDARIPKGGEDMKIRICKLNHNHPIMAENKRFMASYRGIPDYWKRRMELYDGARISITQSHQAMVLEGGGHENLPFNGRDTRKAINLIRRLSRLGGDAVALEDYFEKMTSENKEFYYAIEKDDENRLMNVFWADARCRSMFKSFPDAVTYDTTFAVNRNDMPFSPFVGVNHHGKSVILAAALISHEDTETFTWVMNRWLDCMGKPPGVMITDQCGAIGKAIKAVFGHDYPHRLCLWHIMKNAGKNLGNFAQWSEIEKYLGKSVHDSLEASEFEELWLAS